VGTTLVEASVLGYKTARALNSTFRISASNKISAALISLRMPRLRI